MNGYIESAKYQSDIIYDIEMTCGCVVFLQKGYIFMISRHAITLNIKKTRLFLDCIVNEYPFWNDQEFAGHESYRKRLEYNEERDW